MNSAQLLLSLLFRCVLGDLFGSLQYLFHPASVPASQNYDGPETVRPCEVDGDGGLLTLSFHDLK